MKTYDLPPGYPDIWVCLVRLSPERLARLAFVLQYSGVHYSFVYDPKREVFVSIIVGSFQFVPLESVWTENT